MLSLELGNEKLKKKGKNDWKKQIKNMAQYYG